jgi:hypothetical protein
MVSGVNSALLGYLNLIGSDGSGSDATSGNSAAFTAANAKAAAKVGTGASAQAALQKAASGFKTASQGRTLDAAQKALASDLRKAMSQAGVTLGGNVDFSLSSSGAVEIKGSDADTAAVKAFLKADTSKPGFVSRIAGQAKDAMKLSSTIQQSAAISQAARYGTSTGGVMALYNSLMQNAGATTVVFSVSADTSSLSYPGALATQA